MINAFVTLAVQTVKNPRSVAQYLLANPIGREALLTGYALVLVMNALLLQALLQIVPIPPDFALVLPNPVGMIFAGVVNMLGMVAALTLSGRLLGGSARMGDVARVMLWLMGLGVAVQVAVVVLMLIVPLVAGLLLVANVIISFWVMLHFINEAHGLGGLAKAFLTVVLAAVAYLVVMSLIEATLGLPSRGIVANV